MQQPEPTTDIAAVLSVIVRRDDKNRDREKSNGWRLNFRGTDLRGADLVGAHLEGADLRLAEGIAPNQIAEAYGDSRTILPQGLTRSEHWASGS